MRLLGHEHAVNLGELDGHSHMCPHVLGSAVQDSMPKGFQQLAVVLQTGLDNRPDITA